MEGSQLDQALRQLWQTARTTWPGFEVDPDRFVSHVTRHCEDGDDQTIARLHGDDLYLVCGCLDGDPAALRGFEDQVLPAAAAAIARIDRSPHFADEVNQRLRTKLLVTDGDHPPKLADYAGRGPLATWVRVTAVRAALDLKGSVRREVQIDPEQIASLALESADPAVEMLKQRYAAEFAQGLATACDALSPRQRSVLRLRLVDGLSIDQIGDIYGVHRATVARWISAAREQVLDRVRREIEAHLALSDSEYESLLRVVRSRIDLSITQLLGSSVS